MDIEVGGWWVGSGGPAVAPLTRRGVLQGPARKGWLACPGAAMAALTRVGWVVVVVVVAADVG